MRWIRHGLVFTILLLLSGCIQEPTVPAADVYVLDYTIVDLAPSDEQNTAEPGHHCGDARKQGDQLTIWLWPEEQRPDGPWLAVFPSMPDDWRAGIGASPFKTTFPATVDPGVHEDPTILGELEWAPSGENGTMRLDGKAIRLPHTWSVMGEGGSWRADATLYAWQHALKVDRYEGLCD